MTAEAIRQELYRELENLPTYRLHEVLDFVAFLLNREEQRATKWPFGFDSEHDPLLEVIGMMEAEPFSQKIDEALYGA